MPILRPIITAIIMMNPLLGTADMVPTDGLTTTIMTTILRIIWNGEKDAKS